MEGIYRKKLEEAREVHDETSHVVIDNGLFKVSVDLGEIRLFFESKGLTDGDCKQLVRMLVTFSLSVDDLRIKGENLGSHDPLNAVLCTSGIYEFAMSRGVDIKNEEFAPFTRELR